MFGGFNANLLRIKSQLNNRKKVIATLHLDSILQPIFFSHAGIFTIKFYCFNAVVYFIGKQASGVWYNKYKQTGEKACNKFKAK